MLSSIRTAGFQYSHTMGRHDNAGESFRSPVSLALSKDGRMYVVSRGAEVKPTSRRVTVLTLDEELITEFGFGVSTREQAEEGLSQGPILWPTCLALDKQGNVYLADEGLGWVSIFDPSGKFLDRWGFRGTRDGEFIRPAAIALDQDDNLFMVDAGNNRIQKFTREGKFLGKWGKAGTGDGEFNLPWGLEVDINGDIYVADWRNDRIQKFTAQGEFLMKFGASGNGEGQFNRPTGVAVDKDGIIYVTDWGNDRLEVFESDGRFITQMSGDATLSKWAKSKLDANAYMWEGRQVAYGLDRERLFAGPIAVEVDDADRIFVLETGRSRIQVYRKLPSVFLGIKL